VILLLFALAGFHFGETPPADADSALSILSDSIKGASPRSLGIFFAEIGLEASPDEVQLWGINDFSDLLMEFSDLSADSGTPDSLMPLLEGLPLELLAPAP